MTLTIMTMNDQQYSRHHHHHHRPRRGHPLPGVFSPARRLTNGHQRTPVSNKRKLTVKLASAGTNNIGKATQTHVKSPPCNLYIGNNFCVRIYDFFDLQNSIQNNKRGGLVHIDFDPAVHFKAMTLSEGAEKIWSVPNAGGNSVISEVLSFETFHKCFHAELLRTEMEVAYFPEGGSITDYVCDIFGTKVGVSVTRAMKYRGDYTEEDATNLLTKKLRGVNQANRNSLERWNKQILHVWVQNKETANLVTRAWQDLPQTLSLILWWSSPGHAGQTSSSITPEKTPVRLHLLQPLRRRRSDFIFYNPCQDAGQISTTPAKTPFTTPDKIHRLYV